MDRSDSSLPRIAFPSELLPEHAEHFGADELRALMAWFFEVGSPVAPVGDALVPMKYAAQMICVAFRISRASFYTHHRRELPAACFWPGAPPNKRSTRLYASRVLAYIADRRGG